ncbi:MAG: hypothetical protein ACI4KB_04195 [Oscillospiraceae bacterium]
MSTKEMLHIEVDDLTEEQAAAIYTFIRLMKSQTTGNKTRAQKAYDTIAKLRKATTTITDQDYREDYYNELERKYESLD